MTRARGGTPADNTALDGGFCIVDEARFCRLAPPIDQKWPTAVIGARALHQQRSCRRPTELRARIQSVLNGKSARLSQVETLRDGQSFRAFPSYARFHPAGHNLVGMDGVAGAIGYPYPFTGQKDDAIPLTVCPMSSDF